ncbi:MAG: hypothetical protein ACQER9_04325 [Nanobdellota archaeon]
MGNKRNLLPLEVENPLFYMRNILEVSNPSLSIKDTSEDILFYNRQNKNPDKNISVIDTNYKIFNTIDVKKNDPIYKRFRKYSENSSNEEQIKEGFIIEESLRQARKELDREKNTFARRKSLKDFVAEEFSKLEFFDEEYKENALKSVCRELATPIMRLAWRYCSDESTTIIKYNFPYLKKIGEKDDHLIVLYGLKIKDDFMPPDKSIYFVKEKNTSPETIISASMN